MLVLSRKRNEKVLIDGGITVEVLQIKGNTVRLGISAPSDVKVMRGELKPYGNERGRDADSSGSCNCWLAHAEDLSEDSRNSKSGVFSTALINLDWNGKRNRKVIVASPTIPRVTV